MWIQEGYKRYRICNYLDLAYLIHNIFKELDMADTSDKWPENIDGKFYVDEQCIDCDLCRETAPDFFSRNDDGGYSFVHKQPKATEDIELCMEALEGCPVEAIGEDGDE